MPQATIKDWIKTLKPNDTVLYVNETYNQARHEMVTIERIGRSLIHTNRYSFFIDSGLRKYDIPAGRIYPNAEAYEAELVRNAKWKDLCRKISFRSNAPENMTDDQLDDLLALFTKAK